MAPQLTAASHRLVLPSLRLRHTKPRTAHPEFAVGKPYHHMLAHPAPRSSLLPPSSSPRSHSPRDTTSKATTHLAASHLPIRVFLETAIRRSEALSPISTVIERASIRRPDCPKAARSTPSGPQAPDDSRAHPYTSMPA